ncbi:MAG: AMP-binding protein [Actinobacteria bacterium]|nr:AMP-binding protein [Actinomycetota bacterium]
MLATTVAEAGSRYGDRIAVRTSAGDHLTYSGLDRASDEAAVGLAALGITRGSLVLLSLPSGLDYLVAYVAAAKLGASTGGINPRLSPSERCDLASAVAPDLVLAGSELADGLPGDLRVELVEPGTGSPLCELRSTDSAPPPVTPDPEEPVCLCFTSGSTGQPRAAWFGGRQLLAAAELDTGGAWGGGHLIAGTAMAHVGFMTKLPWQLAAGATIHVMDRWSAGEVLDLVDTHRMPAVNGVAAQVALMLRHPDFDLHDFSCVQAIVVGAGTSPPDLVREARERFGAPYSNRYSSTESGGAGLATALDADDEEALHTVGRPRPGIAAEVRDPECRPVPKGELGELWLRTPTAMSGYWRDPQRTADVLVDGWLRTGDLARVDDRGCFRLSGRTGEMFIRGGYNVHPQEVEAVIGTHPAVAQIVVVPRADDVMGEVGVAVVVPTDPSDPPTLEGLRTHGAGQLARFKLPEALRLVAELPLNSGDKVDRRRLTADEEGG